MRKVLIMFLLCIFSTMTFSYDMDDISVGIPETGGTGCPAGTARATISPDRKSISILFDAYFAEAGEINGQRYDRKSCNIAVPVHVPQGFSLSVFKIDYRGFIMAPRYGYGRFNVEYFFAGSEGPKLQRTLRGPIINNYLFSNDIAAEAVTWTPCGEDVNLRANTSIFLKTNSRMEDAMITVDTADFKAGIKYKLQWRRCKY